MRAQQSAWPLPYLTAVCAENISVRALCPQVMLRSVFRCLRTNLTAGQRNMSQSSLSGKVAIVTASTDG